MMVNIINVILILIENSYNIKEEKSTTCWPNSEEKLNEKPTKCENFQIVKR